MKQFKHVTPRSVEEATAILAEHGCKARIIAGGTDLLGEMKDRILRDGDYPEVLVNIKRIADLDYVAATVTAPSRSAPSPSWKTWPRANWCAPHTRRWPKPPTAPPPPTSGRWAPWRATSARTTAAGTTGWPTTGSTACARAAKPATRSPATPGITPSSAQPGWPRRPAREACPNSIDIPTYLATIREGDTAGAARILLRQNPLPAMTGRVCPHTCETDCARGEFDEAVSIREVERHLGDQILEAPGDYYKAPAQTTGKKVAIVGAGPAGLSAAHYLRSAGHDVTVFEKMPEAGGLLNYGIPPYRLPRDILRKQVAAIEGEGVKFELGTEVDQAAFARLQQDFDAIFLGTGAWQSTPAGVKGEECLTSGTEFLRSQKLERGRDGRQERGDHRGRQHRHRRGPLAAAPGRQAHHHVPPHPGRDARHRRGCPQGRGGGREVRVPHDPPVAAEEDAGEVELTCCRMQLGDLDASGRPRPVKVEGSEFAMQCDAVMTAIVEKPDYSFLPAAYLDEKGRLRIDEASHEVGAGAAPAGVYAGGDFVTGPATVAAAINAGHEAARSINTYLMGAGAALPGESPDGLPEAEAPVCTIGQDFSGSCMRSSERVDVPELSLERAPPQPHRRGDGTLDRAAVKAEADRCFNCGCVAVNTSDLAPALIALDAHGEDLAAHHRRRGLLRGRRQHQHGAGATARWCWKSRCRRPRRARARPSSSSPSASPSTSRWWTAPRRSRWTATWSRPPASA